MFPKRIRWKTDKFVLRLLKWLEAKKTCLVGSDPFKPNLQIQYLKVRCLKLSQFYYVVNWPPSTAPKINSIKTLLNIVQKIVSLTLSN